jgi:hypothetical protein
MLIVHQAMSVLAGVDRLVDGDPAAVVSFLHGDFVVAVACFEVVAHGLVSDVVGAAMAGWACAFFGRDDVGALDRCVDGEMLIAFLVRHELC